MSTSATPVPIPIDCTDGFTEAFYGGPEAFLNPEVRAAQSAWQFADPAEAATCARARSSSAPSGWSSGCPDGVSPGRADP